MPAVRPTDPGEARYRSGSAGGIAAAQAEIGHQICSGRRELWCDGVVGRATEETNRRMLRARDAMDRAYAQPLDVPALARIAHVSEAHFSRIFRATFGETPHRYLQRRPRRARDVPVAGDRPQRNGHLLQSWLRKPGNL